MMYTHLNMLGFAPLAQEIPIIPTNISGEGVALTLILVGGVSLFTILRTWTKSRIELAERRLRMEETELQRRIDADRADRSERSSMISALLTVQQIQQMGHE